MYLYEKPNSSAEATAATRGIKKDTMENFILIVGVKSGLAKDAWKVWG